MQRSTQFLVPIALAIAASGFTSARANETLTPLNPDWSETATIDPYGRPNPYGWDEATLNEKIRAGRHHALNYPVSTTGLLLPEKTSYKFMAAKPGEPLFNLIKSALSLSSDFKNFKGIWDWMGLHNYPDSEDQIPLPKSRRETRLPDGRDFNGAQSQYRNYV